MFGTRVYRMIGLNHVLNFGKHKGFSLKEIYQYEPGYIEWLVEFIPGFIIHPQDFEVLSAPTIWHNEHSVRNEDGTLNFKAFVKPSGNESIAEIKERGSLKEIDFHFSQKTLTILAEKTLGTYSAPHWQRIEDLPTYERSGGIDLSQWFSAVEI